jgi:tetratricopeptide (TPR) repeat protein
VAPLAVRLPANNRELTFIGERFLPLYAGRSDPFERFANLALAKQTRHPGKLRLGEMYAWLSRALPNFAEAHYACGQLFYERKEHGLAIAALRHALQKATGQQTREQIALALGRALLQANRADEARQMMKPHVSAPLPDTAKKLQTRWMALEYGYLQHLIEALDKEILWQRALGESGADLELSKGLSFAALSDFKQSASVLNTALNKYTDPSIMQRERERDANAEARYHQAQFHYGRVLFEEDEDLTGAVSALAKAVKLNPDNEAAYRLYGLSILRLIERDNLQKIAEQALLSFVEKNPEDLESVREQLERLRGTSPGA